MRRSVTVTFVLLLLMLSMAAPADGWRRRVLQQPLRVLTPSEGRSHRAAGRAGRGRAA
jgi:hypothetical protein